MHVALYPILGGSCPTVVSLNDVSSHDLAFLGGIGLLTFKLREMTLVGILALRATGTNFAFELPIVFFFLVDPIVWLLFRFLPEAGGEQLGCEAEGPSLPSMVSGIVWLMGVNLDILTLLKGVFGKHHSPPSTYVVGTVQCTE